MLGPWFDVDMIVWTKRFWKNIRLHEKMKVVIFTNFTLWIEIYILSNNFANFWATEMLCTILEMA